MVKKWEIGGALDYRTILMSFLRQRDGKLCFWCKLEVAPDESSVEHVVPRYLGGSNEAENIRLAHLKCNMARPRPKQPSRWSRPGETYRKQAFNKSIEAGIVVDPGEIESSPALRQMGA